MVRRQSFVTLICFVIPILVAAVVAVGCGETQGAPSAGSSAAIDMSSIEAAAGIPPNPDQATVDAYVAALNAIDPDIVGSKPDRAVSRGRDQCRAFKSAPGDRAKQVDQAVQRFTSPSHPAGFDRSVAERILDVVHQYICPTF